MHYFEVIPVKELARFIECFWILDIDEIDQVEGEKLLLPEGTFDMIFNFGDPVRRIVKEQGGDSCNIQLAGLIGQRLNTIRLERGRNLKLLGVRFKPFGLFPFVKMPLHEITDQVVDIKTAFRTLGAQLESRVPDAMGWKERIALMQRILISRLPDTYAIDPTVKGAVNTLLINRGNVKIIDMHRELGVSKSNLEQKFQDKVGIGPKDLARIWRMNHFILERISNPQASLTQLVYECNYFDQSHLIKEFKRIVNVNPVLFFKMTKGSLVIRMFETSSFKRFNGAYLQT